MKAGENMLTRIQTFTLIRTHTYTYIPVCMLNRNVIVREPCLSHSRKQRKNTCREIMRKSSEDQGRCSMLALKRGRVLLCIYIFIYTHSQ